MATAVVLGGGVSGLAAAYYLQRLQSRFAKVIVLEGKSRVGGWVNTTRTADGAKFEHGPRSFRPAGQSGVNTIDLVDELGLSGEVLSVPASHPSAKYRYIYKDGKCHPLPSGISSVLKTVPPFSRPWIISLAAEPFKASSAEPDESIDSFVRRRLGAEIADYAINPMCRGIFAGDSKILSVRSCMPPLFAFEKDDGSLVKGTIWPSKGRNEPERRTALSQRAKSDGWAAWSLKEGSAQLTDRMLQALSHDPRVEVRTGSPVTSVSPADGKLQVKTDGETIKADHVFSSIYSAALSDVLPVEMKELRETLSSIPSSTVAVVNLEYAGHVLPFQGFGHLLPTTEDSKMLGIVYDSCVFPQHDRPDQPTTRLTCMMGGAWFHELESGVTELTDDYLLSLATQAVSSHLGISAKPTRTIVRVQKDCIPQYLVGHWQKLEAIDSLTESARMPISYIGASYRGPSVNDCIYNAKLEVEKVVSGSSAVGQT